MAEYLSITNDEGRVFIDDSYQNYHLIDKVVIADVTKLQPYQTGRAGDIIEQTGGYSFSQYIYTVTSLKKPVVAYKVGGSNSGEIMGITYTETSTNNWTIKIMFYKSFGNVPTPSYGATLYIFGLLPVSAAPTKGAVFQVFNSLGELVYDSGRKPMQVVQFESTIVNKDWLYPWYKTIPKKTYPIKNYDVNKVYAVIPCTYMYGTIYSNPNFFYYTSTYTRISNNNPSSIVVIPEQSGVSNILYTTNAPSMECWGHAFMLIDVTGY